jgi:hypothetical protein
MEIPPWSFSTIESYETCPAKYEAARVSRKYPDSQNEASIWGNRVHAALEKRVASKTPLPAGMEQWEPLAASFDNHGGKLLTEYRYALNKQFGPTQWKTAWTRGIIDVGVVRVDHAAIYDWKTGKPKADAGQLKLSAAAMMHSFPYLKTVTTGYIWLKDNTLKEDTFTREDLPAIWGDFLPRVVKWENSYKLNKWEKRPSGLCNGWCSNLDCTFNSKRSQNGDKSAGLESAPESIPG